MIRTAVLKNMTRCAKTKQTLLLDSVLSKHDEALHGQFMDHGSVWPMHSPRRWIGWGFPSICPRFQPGSYAALTEASVGELGFWIWASSPLLQRSRSPVCTTGRDEQLLDSSEVWKWGTLKNSQVTVYYLSEVLFMSGNDLLAITMIDLHRSNSVFKADWRSVKSFWTGRFVIYF